MAKGAQFIRYILPILYSLREMGGSATAAEVTDAVIEREGLLEELPEQTNKNAQSKVRDQIAWAQIYLVHSGHIDSSIQGVWRLTEKGQHEDLKSLNDNDISSYERAVHASQPIAYWRMGEARGPNVIDMINGHNGTLYGTPSLQQTGAIVGDPNTAIMLDGRNSYIEIPSHQDFSQCTSGEGLTIEVWFRPDLLEFEGESDDPYIHWLAKGSPHQQEWALRFYSAKSMRPNRISAYIFNPIGGEGVGAYFQDELIAGEWIHVVACFDPGNADAQGVGVSIYKDGKRRLGPPCKSTLYNNPPLKIFPMPGAAPLRLGTRDLKNFLVGALDEVAIYPRVLTANEVWNHYQLGSGVRD